MRDSVLKSKANIDPSGSNLKTAIAQKLIKGRAARVEKKRSLSNHIGSRWYRAPEVSLVEK